MTSIVGSILQHPRRMMMDERDNGNETKRNNEHTSGLLSLRQQVADFYSVESNAASKWGTRQQHGRESNR